jgi:NTP pyrophosphatase (non-canonical NTP hydrolase)
MGMKKQQEFVRKFVDKYKLRTNHDFLLMVIVEELGELAKEIRGSINYNTNEFTPTKEFHEEFGDLFMNLIRLANSSDVDMEKALNATLQKMADRIEQKGHPGSRE